MWDWSTFFHYIYSPYLLMGAAISLAYHDSWSEIESYLDVLDAAQEDVIEFDLEQGWELLTVRQGDYFHIREGDGDGQEYDNVALPRAPLLASAAALREAMPPLIARLTEAVGMDCWTTHRLR